MTLELNGIPLIIDPGTDEINSKTRRYLRGTRAHNTVTVDGEDQSILGEKAEVWLRANQRLEFWGAIPDCDVMIGSHDGYKRLPGVITHTRYIIAMRDKYWLIYDQIEGKGLAKAEQRFHLAPGASLEEGSSHSHLVIRKEKACLSFLPRVIFRNNRKCENSNSKTEMGIAEFEFGQVIQIPVINTVSLGTLPFSMAVVLIPNDFQNADIAVNAKFLDAANSVASIEIKASGIKDKIYLRTHNRKIYNVPEGWQTDGRIFLFRHEQQGKNNCVFAIDATLIADASHRIHLGAAGLEPIKKVFIGFP